MPTIDRKAVLPREAKELIQRRLDELTQELQARFDPGFRPGVYILHTVDKAELPDDGLWLVFGPNMELQMGIFLVEAGYRVMKDFVGNGLFEEIEKIRKTRQNSPAAYRQLSPCGQLKKSGFIRSAAKRLFSSLA
jgi:hypothetical protein